MLKERKPFWFRLSSQEYGTMEEMYDAARSIFLDELQSIYWAEEYLLPKLAASVRAAENKKLRSTLALHYKITEIQIIRLEGIFINLHEMNKAKKCKPIIKIFKEGDIYKDKAEKTRMLDARIILTWRKVGHYEIAAYGELIKLARFINLEAAAEMLDVCLEEEMDENADLLDIEDKCIYKVPQMEDMLLFHLN